MRWRQRFEVLLFYIPLAVPQIMMSLVQGIIMASLARLDDASTVIAAFTLAFGVAIVVEAPIMPARQIAMTLVRDQRSWRVVRNTVWLSGLMLVIVAIPITYGTPLARLTLQGVFGVPDNLLLQTMVTYSVMMFLAPLALTRFLFHGVLIGQRKPLFIAIALALRLGLMLLLAYPAITRGWIPPLIAGPVVMLTGIVVESLIIFLAARHLLAKLPEVSTDHPPIRPSEVLRLLAPLSGALLVFTFSRPAINAALGRSLYAEDSLASIGLSNVVVFTTMGLLLGIHQLAAVFGTDKAGRSRVVRFAVGLGLLLTLVLAFLGLTPTGMGLLEGLVGVPANLHEPFTATIRALIAWPLLFALSDYTQGILLIERRTKLIGLSRTIGVLTSIGLMYWLVGYGRSPAQLTGLAVGVMVIGTAVELLLMAGTRWFVDSRGFMSNRAA